MKPTVTIIKPQVVTPPNRVRLEISEQQARNLHELLSAGCTLDVLDELDLTEVLTSIYASGLTSLHPRRFGRLATLKKHM